MGTLRHKIIAVCWHALPGLSIIAALLLRQILLPVGSVRDITPSFAFMAVFFWCVNSPERISYRLLFVTGLLEDALTSGLMGVSSLLWMGLRKLMVMLQEELEDTGFTAIWCFFSLSLLAMLAAQWVSASVFSGIMALPISMPLQFLVGILCYPSMHHILNGFSKRLYRKAWFVIMQA